MPEVTADTANAERLTKAIATLPKRFTADLDKAVKEAANDLARETRTVLRSAGRRRTKGAAKPSAPGAAPAVQTGLLARSVRVRKGRRRRDDINWRVATVFYGRFLEVGANRGAEGGKLLPRPWATIARRKQAPRYVERVAEAIGRVLEEVSV